MHICRITVHFSHHSARLGETAEYPGASWCFAEHFVFNRAPDDPSTASADGNRPQFEKRTWLIYTPRLQHAHNVSERFLYTGDAEQPLRTSSEGCFIVVSSRITFFSKYYVTTMKPFRRVFLLGVCCYWNGWFSSLGAIDLYTGDIERRVSKTYLRWTLWQECPSLE